MPNWCNNSVTFSHKDQAMIARLLKSVDGTGSGLFSEFVPRPVNEEDNWYNWNISNWGTKWDVDVDVGTQKVDENTVVIDFDTAWAPPIEFYAKMRKLGFVIEAYYNEPGVGFCGLWNDGDDAFYDYSEFFENGKFVGTIPPDIDEVMGITDYFNEIEEMNDD